MFMLSRFWMNILGSSLVFTQYHSKKMHVGRGRESAEPGLRAIEQQMLLTTLLTCGKPTASSSKAHLCHALCCYI